MNSIESTILIGAASFTLGLVGVMTVIALSALRRMTRQVNALWEDITYTHNRIEGHWAVIDSTFNMWRDTVYRTVRETAAGLDEPDDDEDPAEDLA